MTNLQKDTVAMVDSLIEYSDPDDVNTCLAQILDSAGRFYRERDPRLAWDALELASYAVKAQRLDNQTAVGILAHLANLADTVLEAADDLSSTTRDALEQIEGATDCFAYFDEAPETAAANEGGRS